MKNLLIILCLTSCMAIIAQKDVRGISYGPSKQNIFDLFLPEVIHENTKVVVLLHGGAWSIGGNEYTDKTARDLRDRGFVVANVDYRYVSESVHAVQLLDDIDSAISKLQVLSSQYHFNASRIHMAGISAGAHLALLYGYTSKKNIASISALCPPTRLDDPETLAYLQKHNLQRTIELLADAKLIAGQRPPTQFSEVSPYKFIKSIPTLLVHGDADTLVPYSQSAFLYGLLRQKKIKSELVTMKGKGHDAGMNDRDSEKLVLDKITGWINQ